MAYSIQFAISTDTANGDVNEDALKLEVNAAGLSVLCSYVDTDEGLDAVYVHFDTVLPGSELSTLVAVLLSHQATSVAGAGEDFGSERAYAERTTPHVHTSESYRTSLSLEAPLIGGQYRLDWWYEWAVDSTSKDFVAQIRVGSTEIAKHQQEAKDSGGSDGGTGSGTNQRHSSSGFWEGDLAAGTHTLDLRTRTENDDVEVTVYRARLALYRVK